ncbi:MAG: lamin tail domain-containing protein, partial [Myxococcales bacterium]|nr:lamin tail domain-containing protein [Myxococcales bacterium]
LEPGEPLWLAVAAWATDGSRTLGEVYLLPLEVAAGAAGASLVGSWPPDESAGVPADLPFAALHFDGEVTGVRAGIHLEGADGSEVPAEVGITDCAPIGFAAGRCALLRPLAELEPESRYRLRVSEQVVDTTGAAVGPRITRFSTARLPPATPTLLALPCALDEESVEGVCLLRDDRSVAIRAAASGPMRAFWSGAGQTIGAVAVRGEIELRLGELEPRTPLSLELRLVDLGGAERRLRIASGTRAPLAPIFITEVRADPSGPEPRQEYVEVVNSGPLPLSLEAFSITDDPLRAGDPLPASAPLPSGARALLVADAFEPDHPDDDLVPEGVPLIRVGRALGSGGLSAVGEPVLLRDAEGRRLSGAPARPSAGPGRCLVRTSEDGRRMDAQAFAWDAAGGCTPGLPDRTPERP